MKLLEKDFAVNQTGTAKIIPEEPDDLWLLYNLINPGDYVTADTTRKVHLDPTKRTASRVRLSLHLKVTCRDFHKDSSTLRIHGRNLEANSYVAAGSFHTITIERNNPLELRKRLWNEDAVEALRQGAENDACSEPELAVLILQEQTAEIYLIGKGVTKMVAKVEALSSTQGAGGGGGRKGGSSGKNVFFSEVFGAFVKHVDLNKVKSVVIASGDTRKDDFRRFLMSEAKRMRMRSIEENRGRIVVAGLGGNNKGGGDLREVLGESTVMNLMKGSDVGLEITALRELWDMVSNNSDRACYGPKNVESAHEMRAIETLLISDELYRSDEIGTRKRYADLVKSVKESGGKVLVYSSMHVMAQQLQQLTGVAAILRFPLPDLEDIDGCPEQDSD